jgi:ribosomal protein S8
MMTFKISNCSNLTGNSNIEIDSSIMENIFNGKVKKDYIKEMAVRKFSFEIKDEIKGQYRNRTEVVRKVKSIKI